MAYPLEQRALPAVTNSFYAIRNNDDFVLGSGRLASISGVQQTRSHRTTPQNTLEDQYSAQSTRQLRKNIGDEHRQKWDTGHDFFTQRTVYGQGVTMATLNGTTSQGGVTYTGPVYVRLLGIPVNVRLPSVTYPSTSRKMADGTEAINRTMPTRPQAGLAQVIGEAKERLPQLIGFKSYRDGLSVKNTGGEYLNVEFGIKPLISDVISLAKSVKNSRELLAQLVTDAASDKIVRRRTHLYDDQETIIQPDAGASLDIGIWAGRRHEFEYLSVTSVPLSVVDHVRHSSWFSGAYTYHLSQAEGALGQLEQWEQKANYLLGTRINASLIWELTPWSWLLDWHANIGTLVSNLDAFHSDNLVMRYGYVMHETHATRYFTAKDMVADKTGQSHIRPYAYSSIVRKERTRATPYGFGLDVSQFSPRRWAILGALGMARSPGTLRAG